MVQVQENTVRLGDDVVGFFAFDVDEETDAASFMLELRIIEPLLAGSPDAGALGAALCIQ